MGKRPRHVDAKKDIGYLPEESYLYRFLSARETLDYYGRLFRIPAPIRRERVSKLLEMVGLEAVEHRPVGEFSKGMQRRVGLAQSLINDPQLLILDEPTSGMDPVGARQIKDVIEKLAERGKTILLCTHLLSDVEDLCERVAIMFGGKVRAEGTCGELLEQQDLTNLQTDRLPADALAEIEAVLAKRGLGLRSVEQPRRRLESLFLEIVDTARKEGTHTSGARSGGQIADFLRAGATEVAGDTEADGEGILDSLAAKAAVPQPAPAATAKAAVREAVHEEGDALADLVARPTPPPAAARPAQAPQAVEADTGPDEDPDDDVLASLTKKVPATKSG
jgi:ABC-2 type transport system ATP-binding protein